MAACPTRGNRLWGRARVAVRGALCCCRCLRGFAGGEPRWLVVHAPASAARESSIAVPSEVPSISQLNSSRLLVTATTATTGISTTTAELKRQTPSMGFDLRSVLHVPMGSSTQASLAADVRRRDYAVSLKLATTGAVYGAYHQLVGMFPAFDGLRLTAAAEVMVSDLFRSPLTTRDAVFPLRVKGPSADPGLTYAAAIAGTSGDSRHSGVLALQQVRMGLPKVEAQYVHAASKHTTAVAAVEFNALTSESKASVGYRTRFPRTRSVFTASMTSDGGIRACFERALLSNVRGTIALDTTVIPNPPRRPGQEIGASVRLAIGPQPRINLELTPVLLRDAPRVWQK